MMTRNVAGAFVAVTILLVFGSTADAQLPKRGSYSGVYGWHFTGQTVAVDRDHVAWGGTSTGAFRNDAGDGFLHAAVVVCTAAGEFRKGSVTHNDGDCVVTDRDGDKA